MNEDYEDECETYPESAPAPGINRYDLIRIVTLPFLGWAQGSAAMFDQFHSYLIMQSRIHDERVEAARLDEAFNK